MDKRIVVIVLTKNHSSNTTGCPCSLFQKTWIEKLKKMATSAGYRFEDIRYNTKTDNHWDFVDYDKINFPQCLYNIIPWVPLIFAVTEKDYMLMERGGPFPEMISVYGVFPISGRIERIYDAEFSYKDWINQLYKLISIPQPVQYLRKRSIVGK